MNVISRIAAATLLLAAPLAALAADGFVTRDVNLRAGPDTDFPRIMTLDAGEPVEVLGCIDGWSWCDVVAEGERGWVYGRYVELEYGGRQVYLYDYGPRLGIPIVSFSIGSYWDRHYRGREWYGRRDYWSSRYPRYASGTRYYSDRNHSGRNYSGRSYSDRNYRSGTRYSDQTYRSGTRYDGSYRSGYRDGSRTYSRQTYVAPTQTYVAPNAHLRTQTYARQQSRDQRRIESQQRAQMRAQVQQQQVQIQQQQIQQQQVQAQQQYTPGQQRIQAQAQGYRNYGQARREIAHQNAPGQQKEKHQNRGRGKDKHRD